MWSRVFMIANEWKTISRLCLTWTDFTSTYAYHIFYILFYGQIKIKSSPYMQLPIHIQCCFHTNILIHSYIVASVHTLMYNPPQKKFISDVYVQKASTTDSSFGNFRSNFFRHPFPTRFVITCGKLVMLKGSCGPKITVKYM